MEIILPVSYTHLPFTLDSKAPTASYKDFLKGEVRYTSLALKDPERAEMLFDEAEELAAEKYEHLTRMVDVYSTEE